MSSLSGFKAMHDNKEYMCIPSQRNEFIDVYFGVELIATLHPEYVQWVVRGDYKDELAKAVMKAYKAIYVKGMENDS